MSDPAAAVASLAEALTQRTTRPWTVMEVCGGQTHSLLRWGLDQLLPADLRLIHGPGCPVCVTPAATIDQALALARTPGVILCTYGDMLRVPGTERAADLLAVRAAGGNVQLLTSPLQALHLAQEKPDQQVVFLAV
ncbi:MAG: hydrogenase formation protein HypD, partial [Cyanobium sp.]